MSIELPDPEGEKEYSFTGIKSKFKKIDDRIREIENSSSLILKNFKRRLNNASELMEIIDGRMSQDINLKNKIIEGSNLDHTLGIFDAHLAIIKNLEKEMPKESSNSDRSQKQTKMLKYLESKLDELLSYLSDLIKNPERLEYVLTHKEINDAEEEEIQRKIAEREKREEEEKRAKAA